MASRIAINDKNDNFMAPDFEYSVITEDYKVVETLDYDKPQQFECKTKDGRSFVKYKFPNKAANSNEKEGGKRKDYDSKKQTDNRDNYRKNKKKKGNNKAVYMQAARGGKRR